MPPTNTLQLPTQEFATGRWAKLAARSGQKPIYACQQQALWFPANQILRPAFGPIGIRENCRMNFECLAYGKNILVIGVNGRVIRVKFLIIIGYRFRC